MKTQVEIMMGIRNYWQIKPVTKIHGTKKGYDKNNRQQGKKQAKEGKVDCYV